MQNRLSRYGISGLLGTTAHYAVMYLLIVLGASGVFATFVGAMIGALINFLGCRHWVFHDTAHSRRWAALRFVTTSILSLVTNTTMVWSLAPVLSTWVSQLAATLCCFFMGYLINRHWTFSETMHAHL